MPRRLAVSPRIDRGDGPLKVYRSGLLDRAIALFTRARRSGAGILEPIRDDLGRIGYRCARGYLVAKQSLYRGHIVSCHRRLFAEALGRGRPIWMYVADAGRFYRFDPAAVERHRNTFLNRRGHLEMVNWDVRAGRPADPPRAPGRPRRAARKAAAGRAS